MIKTTFIRRVIDEGIVLSKNYRYVDNGSYIYSTPIWAWKANIDGYDRVVCDGERYVRIKTGSEMVMRSISVDMNTATAIRKFARMHNIPRVEAIRVLVGAGLNVLESDNESQPGPFAHMVDARKSMAVSISARLSAMDLEKRDEYKISWTDLINLGITYYGGGFECGLEPNARGSEAMEQS